MKLTMFSKKHQHMEDIMLEVTDEGWLIYADDVQAHCTPNGYPYFFEHMMENGSTYPTAFGDALEELWQSIRQNHLTEQEIQSRLDDFSRWLMRCTLTEAQSPIGL